MKVSPIQVAFLALSSLSLPACDIHKAEESHEQEHHKIVVTSPVVKDVILTQPYVCLIRAQRHIDVRALVDGYLEKILVKEGQVVKEKEPMFKILPILYQARYEAAKAEARQAELEYKYAQNLFEKKVIADTEVALREAKWKKAEAHKMLAEAELKFTDITAPFDGIVDTLHEREGSLIKERDILTTLSDNSVMWVYFNVPEASYLEYMAHVDQDQHAPRLELNLELELANHSKFPYACTGVTVEAKFNPETGNIPFRADFPNPHRLLRHGQTGTILVHPTRHNALIIPQRATFEILDKRYVWVGGEDNKAKQRLVTIDESKLEDIFIIKSGLDVKDKIIWEGVRDVRDGDKVEYEFRPPEEILDKQKNHAE